MWCTQWNENTRAFLSASNVPVTNAENDGRGDGYLGHASGRAHRRHRRRLKVNQKTEAASNEGSISRGNNSRAPSIDRTYMWYSTKLEPIYTKWRTIFLRFNWRFKFQNIDTYDIRYTRKHPFVTRVVFFGCVCLNKHNCVFVISYMFKIYFYIYK